MVVVVWSNEIWNGDDVAAAAVRSLRLLTWKLAKCEVWKAIPPEPRAVLRDH